VKSHPNRKKVVLMVYTCYPKDSGKYKTRGLQLAWAKSKTLSQKQPEQKGLQVWLK
jgi:hypothetical protein